MQYYEELSRQPSDGSTPPPRVALVYTRAAQAPLRTWRPELPPAYRERLARMRCKAARARTLTGLWLLYTGARLAGFGDPDLAALGRDNHDRPMLADGPAFNISHSGDLVACAIARDAPLGLDVERIRPIDAARFDRFLSPEEATAAGRDATAFFTAWTAREAAVKASGRVGLARIARVRIDGNRASVDGERLYLRWPQLAAGYLACLATDRPAAVWIQALSGRVRK